LGYGVAGNAASGEAALRKIADNRPDLVLMDIHLKGDMTGIEVSEKIQSDFQIPVVYLTANADSATFREANQTGPYGYLLKPFGEKELGIAIEIALNKHQQETAVKSSESWYATAFQSIHESVIATDSEGRVVFINAFAESMTGWRLAEAIDQPLADVLTFQQKSQSLANTEDLGSVDSILEAILAGSSVVALPDEAMLMTKFSEQIAVEGNATAIRETSGRIIGSIFTFREEQHKPSAYPKLVYSSASKPTPTEDKGKNKAQSAFKNSATDDAVSAYCVEDVDLVKAFVTAFINQEDAFFSTSNLVASSGEGVTTLSARSEGMVAKVVLVNDKLTAEVKQDSEYWMLLRCILIENRFFPVSRRTNGCCRYQHLEVPEGCRIYHTSGTELMEAWYGNASYGHEINSSLGLARPLREKLVVLRRDKWCSIKALGTSNGGLQIKTILGEIFVSADDSLVWGVRKL